MKVQEIKEIAKKRGVAAGKMKKSDLVRTLQTSEGNNPCYDTGKSDECGQDECLWREDCK